MTKQPNHYKARRGFLFIFLLFFSAVAIAQNETCIVEATADTADILIGEQVTLTVTAKVGAGEKISFPTYSAEDEIVSGVEVIKNGKIDTLLVNNGKRWELSRKYIVTSFDSALYAITPEVYLNGDTIKSRSTIGLKVSSVPVDTTKLDNFVGPYGSVDEEFELNWLFLVSILLFILMAVILIVAIRKFRRNKLLPPQIIVEQVVSPHAEALNAIAKIRELPRNTKEDSENYYTRLSEILRVYLKRRFNVDALNLTTSEIIGVLIREQNVALLNELGEILNTSDLVKFAQYSASLNESDKNLLQAADYIHQTNSQTPPVQPKIVSVEPEENVARRVKRKKLKKYIIAAAILAAILLIYMMTVIIEIFI